MTSYNAFEDYYPPSWSAKPIYNYYLEVLKNGVEVEKKFIDQKAMYLVGKHKDICDIILDNPSISRKHSLFQSKNTGEIFIFDLGSTHGTYVNNIKIPSKLFQKLKIFDQIRFGQSQRLYILRCSKLEDEDNNKQEQDLKDRAEKKKQKKEFRSLKDEYLSLLEKDPTYGFRRAKPYNQQHQEDGISWGMIDEEEIYRYQAEQDYPLEPDLLKMLTNLTNSQLEKINNYAEKLHSFRQIQQEYDALIVKERQNYGLEETSKRKKDTLASKIDEDGQALEQAEETCRFVLFGDKSRSKKFDYIKQESSEEDEYYDNTLAKKQIKQNEENLQEKIKNIERTTENFRDLKTKLELLTEEQTKIHSQLLKLNSNEIKYQEEEGDVLDKFMNQTIKNLADEDRPKLLQRLAEVQKQYDEVSALLKLVKPDVDAKALLFFENEKKDKEIAENEINNQEEKNKKQGIGMTLNKLKQMRKENELKQKIDEDDDEANLEQARKDFEELEKKRKNEEKEFLKREDRLRKTIILSKNWQ